MTNENITKLAENILFGDVYKGDGGKGIIVVKGRLHLRSEHGASLHILILAAKKKR